MPAKAIIINADDLGLCAGVNRGILDAWSAGAIGDSTVFANAPDLPETLAQAREVNLPVGLHLNLTYGCPLSDPAEIPALVSPEGTFMKRQAWALPLPVEQVRREARRQVERLCALGWTPSHLDSHHHVHRYPEVLAVITEIAQEMRLPVRAVDAEMRAALRAAGICTPDYFSMTFYGERAIVDTLIDLADACPGGVLEVMTHPGYMTDHVPSSYDADRARELAALTSAEWRAFLTSRGIPIVGFSALKRADERSIG